MLENLGRDLRHALRVAMQTPGVTAVAVLTLALGIGAATTVFSLVDAVLLRPLFPGQERLVALWANAPDRGREHVELSLEGYRDYRRGSQSFTDLAALFATDLHHTLTKAREEPLHLRGRYVSANFFSLLGVEAALGRTLQPRDQRQGAPPVALISHALWQSRFRSDPRAIGRTFLLDGEHVRLAGVLPADFRFPRGVDLWSPLPFAWGADEARTIRVFQGIGRLKPGVPLQQAREEVAELAARLAMRPEHQGFSANLVPLVDEILGDTRAALHLLTGAVLLVMLIACADVALLLLARAVARRREIAVRAALGAGRGRLAARSLAEGLVLAVPAGVLGLLIAWSAVTLLARYGSADIPRLDEAAVDGWSAAFALLAGAAAAALFGLVPAVWSATPDLSAALKEGGSASASRRESRLRELLVTTQVALSLVLLIGAGLLVRSFQNLQRTDLGFPAERAERLLSFRVPLGGSGYATPADHAAYFRAALARMRRLPGVESAALILMRPLSGAIGWDYSFTVEGQSAAAQRTNPISNHQRVSPGYFATLGIPLVEGRDFTWRDGADAPRVAIVNRSAAERFWPGRSALGQRLHWRRPGTGEPWITVVGVVGDARYRDLGEPRVDIYIPFLQDPHWTMDFVLRTGAAPENVLEEARSALRGIDPDVALADPLTLEQALDQAVARPRLRTLALGAFAGLALLLAAVGLYGLIADSVAQRRHEIGIRLALGASRSHVVRAVLRRSLGLTSLGLAAGLALSLALLTTGWLDGLLHGVSPVDLATFATVPPLLLAVSLVASLLPALRATEVEPRTALRSE